MVIFTTFSYYHCLTYAIFIYIHNFKFYIHLFHTPAIPGWFYLQIPLHELLYFKSVDLFWRRCLFVPCQGLWILIMAKYLGGCFFLPSNFPEEGGKSGNFGEQISHTYCFGWLLKPENWLSFFFWKPLVFSICSCVELPLPKFSSCFQSSYKHPNIRKITKCKVVKALGMENKMGGCIY